MISLANNQLDKTIQAGFQEERENVRDHSEEKKGKAVTIVLSLVMSIVILGSLVYSLLEALQK
ncbi:hypothetical protein MOP89_01915 [Enterococcus gallinarum]|nr:hypothetical protein [Enterococcus gallinarum]